jgi:hypothetical protein
MHNDKREHVATDADAKYDTQFEGDDFAFTLNVSEGSAAVGTVTVQLQAKVTLDNALFIVNKDTGELTRVDVPKSYSNITYHGSQLKPITWTDTPGTRFIDMLVWFDTHYGAFMDGTADADIGGTANAYQKGAEYLIRVAEDEAIPWVYVTMPLEDNATKLRLRGAGAQRVISAAAGKYSNAQYYNCTLHGRSANTGIAVPSAANATRGIINMGRGILQLENNITIRGDDTYDGTNRHRILLQIGLPGTLIMKEGAILTGHTGNQASYSDTVIFLNGTVVTSSDVPCFKMEGGAIRDNRLIGSVIRSEGNSSKSGLIQKTGGLITGNTGVNTETPANIVLFGNNLNNANLVHTIAGDTATVYFLPQ